MAEKQASGPLIPVKITRPVLGAVRIFCPVTKAQAPKNR